MTIKALQFTDEPGKYRLVPTRIQSRLSNGSVLCGLCLWQCKLVHGQRGFCQAHVNRNGTLYNLSYGIISALAVDDIESKPIKHFRPGTKVLSVGSYGCNFRCQGCHNLEISWGVEALDELARGESRAVYVSPDDLIAAAKRLEVDGIAFTYSEPAVWLEYVLDVAELAKANGLYTVYVSNSFVTSEALQLLAPCMDVLCSDIKSMDNQFYRELCAVGNADQVLKSIIQAHESGIHVETRTNIIPTKNDDMDNIRSIAKWILKYLGQDSPWHITRFFPAYHLSHLPETQEELMWRAHDMASEVGLNNVYVYSDKGCDCAQDNLPIAELLQSDTNALSQVKKCSADCCGDEGVLLKKYEQVV